MLVARKPRALRNADTRASQTTGSVWRARGFTGRHRTLSGTTRCVRSFRVMFLLLPIARLYTGPRKQLLRPFHCRATDLRTEQSAVQIISFDVNPAPAT